MSNLERFETLPGRICQCCKTIFSAQREMGRAVDGNKEFAFPIPHTKHTLKLSLSGGCRLCWKIHAAITIAVERAREGWNGWEGWSDWLTLGSEEPAGLYGLFAVDGGVYDAKLMVGRPPGETRTYARVGYLQKVLGDIGLSNRANEAEYMRATRTDSRASMDCIRSWIKNCDENHSCCPQNTDHWAPTRLVDVGAGDEPLRPRLVLTADLPGPVSWFTLSHCWGKTKQVKLLQENVDEFLHGLPVDELSQTFRDALYTTWKLKEGRYLWIDSLCIIQNSSEDWNAEATQMHKIYSLSKCTISASFAEDGAGGCFSQREPRSVFPLLVPSPFEVDHGAPEFLLHSKDMEFDWRENITDGPLYQRAWVVQERLLSPRTIYFCSNQIFWGCGATEASEMLPTGRTQRPYWWDFVGDRRRFVDLLSKPDYLERGHARKWSETVELYCKTKITYPTDRPVAFLGIANAMAEARQIPCAHGISLDDAAPWNLLWSPEKKPASRPEQLLAPSWSWLSLDTPIHSFNPYGTSSSARSTVVSVCTVGTTKSTGPLSPDRDNGLVVKGQLKVTWCDLNTGLEPNRYTMYSCRDQDAEEVINLPSPASFDTHIANTLISTVEHRFIPFEGRAHSKNEMGGFDTLDYKPKSHVAICLPLVDMNVRLPRVGGLILEPVQETPWARYQEDCEPLPVFRRVDQYHYHSSDKNKTWVAGTEDINLIII